MNIINHSGYLKTGPRSMSVAGALAASAAAQNGGSRLSILERTAATPLADQLVALKQRMEHRDELREKLSQIDTTSLAGIEIESEQAFETARINRRDWMNARAALRRWAGSAP